MDSPEVIDKKKFTDLELISAFGSVMELETSFKSVRKKFAKIRISEKDGNEKLLEKSKLLENITEDLSKISDGAAGSAKTAKEAIEYSAGQIIAKRVQILTLEIKKLTIQIKKELGKIKRKICMKLLNTITDPSTSAFAASIIAIISGIGVAITAIISTIDLIMSLIPPNFKLDAKGMKLFMTPKSMSNQDITPMNEGKDMLFKIPQAVLESMIAVINMPKIKNNTEKSAKMAALMAAGETALFGSGLAEAIASYIPTNAKDEGVLQKIMSIFDLTIVPEAMPKYEKLVPWNVSFLIYLVMTFEPAASKSFGIPGM